MIQNIIVFLIIALAIVYTIYSVVKSLRTKQKSGCEGCGGCELKNDIKKSKLKAKDLKYDCHH